VKNKLNIPSNVSPKIIINIQAHPVGKQEIKEIKIDALGFIQKQLDKIKMQSKPVYDSLIDIDCSRADYEGSWSWGTVRDWKANPAYNSLIEAFKSNYHKKKSWKEACSETTGVFEKKHKWYSVKELKKEAEDRLTEVELDDFQDIFRFRLENKFRFYGFPVGNKFFPVWHDPEHKIYGRK
jgi:hypothetical protein